MSRQIAGSDHIKELNNQRPKQPFFFLKPPSCILLPGEGPVKQPSGADLHFEVELGVVIGMKIDDLDPDNDTAAIEVIEGYLLTIDMTARNLQDEAKKKGLPWTIAKGFDTFLPVSRFIPKSAIPDPHDVRLSLTVNDEPRQDDSTALMMFRIPRLLSDISRVMGLEPGDIVLTGTPKGVGRVVVGDRMQATIEVNGTVLEESRIDVMIALKTGPYKIAQT